MTSFAKSGSVNTPFFNYDMKLLLKHQIDSPQNGQNIQRGVDEGSICNTHQFLTELNYFQTDLTQN